MTQKQDCMQLEAAISHEIARHTQNFDQLLDKNCVVHEMLKTVEHTNPKAFKEIAHQALTHCLEQANLNKQEDFVASLRSIINSDLFNELNYFDDKDLGTRFFEAAIDTLDEPCNIAELSEILNIDSETESTILKDHIESLFQEKNYTKALKLIQFFNVKIENLPYDILIHLPTVIKIILVFILVLEHDCNIPGLINQNETTLSRRLQLEFSLHMQHFTNTTIATKFILQSREIIKTLKLDYALTKLDTLIERIQIDIIKNHCKNKTPEEMTQLIFDDELIKQLKKHESYKTLIHDNPVSYFEELIESSLCEMKYFQYFSDNIQDLLGDEKHPRLLDINEVNKLKKWLNYFSMTINNAPNTQSAYDSLLAYIDNCFTHAPLSQYAQFKVIYHTLHLRADSPLERHCQSTVSTFASHYLEKVFEESSKYLPDNRQPNLAHIQQVIQLRYGQQSQANNPTMQDLEREIMSLAQYYGFALLVPTAPSTDKHTEDRKLLNALIFYALSQKILFKLHENLQTQDPLEAYESFLKHADHSAQLLPLADDRGRYSEKMNLLSRRIHRHFELTTVH